MLKLIPVKGGPPGARPINAYSSERAGVGGALPYNEVVIASINPANGETLRTFEELTDAQLDQKLAGAEKAYRTYRRTSFADRARWLAAAADMLESEKDRIGRIMTLEMGKPIAAARAEAVKCAWACRYYAECGERLLAAETIDAGAGATSGGGPHTARAGAVRCAWACLYYAEGGERLLAAETIDAGAGRSSVRYQPIGPVLAVMPWNFPFWQVFRFAAPALMAGNVGLLKH